MAVSAARRRALQRQRQQPSSDCGYGTPLASQASRTPRAVKPGIVFHSSPPPSSVTKVPPGHPGAAGFLTPPPRGRTSSRWVCGWHHDSIPPRCTWPRSRTVALLTTISPGWRPRDRRCRPVPPPHALPILSTTTIGSCRNASSTRRPPPPAGSWRYHRRAQPRRLHEVGPWKLEPRPLASRTPRVDLGYRRVRP